VREICRAVPAMVEVHELQWPQYKWKDEHQRVGKWCLVVCGNG